VAGRNDENKDPAHLLSYENDGLELQIFRVLARLIDAISNTEDK